MEPSQSLSFAELLQARVEAHPEQVALVHPSDQQSLSFRELSQKVEALAIELQRQGVQPLDRVGLQLPNRVEFVVSLLALSQANAIPVLLDTSYKANEVQTILGDCGAAGVLTLASHTKSFESIVFAELEGDFSLSYGAWQRTEPEEVLQDVALFKYTSGSTGVPKGVLLSAADIVAEGTNVSQTLRVTSDDVLLGGVPLFHSYGFDFCVMPMLLTGATLVLMERFLPRPALRLLQEHKVTVFPAVPFMFDLMTRLPIEPDELELSSLRYCISAAAPLSARTVRRFYKTFQQVICQNYGSSEAGAITLEIRRRPGVPSTCLGKPLHRVILKILDEEGKPQPPGAVGEVVVGGPQVSTYGYFRDPELTASTFHEGFCYTGDLGYLDENGDLFLTGRKKNLINAGGKKVSPTEVEGVLAEHPDVQDVAVVGVEDEVLGEVVKACLVTAKEVSVEELVTFCKERLAGYKVPQKWSFWNDLPRTRVGKLDTARLKG